MKANRIFRTLTPYRIEPDGRVGAYAWLAEKLINLDENNENFAPHISRDPEGQVWETIGFTKAFGDEFFRDIQGAGMLAFLRFAKRDLPARVVNARVQEKVQDFIDTMDRNPRNKEKQEMRWEAETELLPKAFIGHTVVPIIVTNDGWLFVFHGAQAKLDHILTFLVGFFSDLGVPQKVLPPSVERSMAGYMTSLALGNQGELFKATDFAVMEHVDNAKIRVQSRDVQHSEVQAALKAGFRIEAVGMEYLQSGMRFRLEETLRLRAIELSEAQALDIHENTEDVGQELMAVAWLATVEYRQMLVDLLAEINETPEGEEEDDEL